MGDATWVMVGAGLGMGFVWGAGRGDAERERRVWGVGLVVAALIYVGFAAAAQRPGWILVEAAGAAAFGGAALLGRRTSPLLLVAGWALHPVWDLGLHLAGAGVEVAPRGYALLCLGFDPVVAVWILWRATRIRPTSLFATLPTSRGAGPEETNRGKYG